MSRKSAPPPVKKETASAPGSSLLPPSERQLFVEQFEKDLKFFQLFFLMVSRACPIQNVDLVWTEAQGPDRVSFRHLGISEALSGPCSRLVGRCNENPHPLFCNIISGFGAHAEESCGVSDHAAAVRAGKTGRSEVYRCDFGLTDIAVPVMWKGCHIATLFSGQVLRHPPSRGGFTQIARDVAHLSHVNPTELERAYFDAPVVSGEEIENTRAILESFAEYLSNSWTRLAEAVKERQRERRELQLTAKEYAYQLLQENPEPRALRELARRLRVTRKPNRVLLLSPEGEAEYAATPGNYDLGLTAVMQAVEDFCESLPNVTATYLRGRGICVFFSDRQARNPAAGNFFSLQLARRLLHAISERTDMRIRVGIGNAKPDWAELQESYREARAALAGSSEPVAAYVQPPASARALAHGAEAICSAIADRDEASARGRITAFAAEVSRRAGKNLAVQRVAFATALDLMLVTAGKQGVESAEIDRLRERVSEGLGAEASTLELEDAYMSTAHRILAETARVYSSRRSKIVERVRRNVERSLSGNSAAPCTVPGLAVAVGVSAGHLSRLFHREQGQTLESFILGQRIERAKRMLLEPTGTVAGVAEACGFSDPNYFSRAFRRIAGCSPREYRQSPAVSRKIQPEGSLHL